MQSSQPEQVDQPGGQLNAAQERVCTAKRSWTNLPLPYCETGCKCKATWHEFDLLQSGLVCQTAREQCELIVNVLKNRTHHPKRLPLTTGANEMHCPAGCHRTGYLSCRSEEAMQMHQHAACHAHQLLSFEKYLKLPSCRLDHGGGPQALLRTIPADRPPSPSSAAAASPQCARLPPLRMLSTAAVSP